MYTWHPNTKINPSTYVSTFRRMVLKGHISRRRGSRSSPCLTRAGLLATGGGSFTGSSSYPLRQHLYRWKGKRCVLVIYTAHRLTAGRVLPGACYMWAVRVCCMDVFCAAGQSASKTLLPSLGTSLFEHSVAWKPEAPQRRLLGV